MTAKAPQPMPEGAVRPPAPKGPPLRNQCDGCAAGIPVEYGLHRMGTGPYPDFMVCTAILYRGGV